MPDIYTAPAVVTAVVGVDRIAGVTGLSSFGRVEVQVARDDGSVVTFRTTSANAPRVGDRVTVTIAT